MISYAYKRKRLQEYPEDRANATTAKLVRHFGVRYMQKKFCALQQGLLLRQYYNVPPIVVQYECFELNASLRLSLRSGKGNLLFFCPLENTFTFTYKQKRIDISPHRYLLLPELKKDSDHFHLPEGITRYCCIIVPNSYIGLHSVSSPQIFHVNKKAADTVEELLESTGEGRPLELFVTSRANDLINFCFSAKKKLSGAGNTRRLEFIADFIRDNLEYPLPDKLLAQKFNSSISVFRKAFTKYFQCAPHKFITNLRMEEARNLLLHTQLSAEQIAWRLGYSYPAAFYHAFVRHFGYTPNVIRYNQLNADNAG